MVGDPEGLLDAVAVVAVDVDVEDTGNIAEHFEDAENNIINVAETGGLALLAVVETACSIYGDVQAAFHETDGGGCRGA